MSVMNCAGRLLVGISSSKSRERVVCCWTFEMSTTGDSPVTVIVSSSPPTLSSAFTVAVNDVVNSMPSRLNVLKPGKVKVTVYGPGRRSTIGRGPGRQ